MDEIERNLRDACGEARFTLTKLRAARIDPADLMIERRRREAAEDFWSALLLVLALVVFLGLVVSWPQNP